MNALNTRTAPILELTVNTGRPLIPVNPAPLPDVRREQKHVHPAMGQGSCYSPHCKQAKHASSVFLLKSHAGRNVSCLWHYPTKTDHVENLVQSVAPQSVHFIKFSCIFFVTHLRELGNDTGTLCLCLVVYSCEEVTFGSVSVVPLSVSHWWTPVAELT